MGVHLKVLEKLDLHSKNNLQNISWKLITLKDDRVLKLWFDNEIGNQEFVLIKAAENSDEDLCGQYKDVTSIATPIFYVNYECANFAVFDGNSIIDYRYQEELDLSHIRVLLDVVSNIHLNFLSKSQEIKANTRNFGVCNYFRKHLLKVDKYFSLNQFDINLKVLVSEFDKILTFLEATSEKANYWVPGFNNTNLLFKYDDHGFPINIKILVTKPMQFVPPVYDILDYIFSYTKKDLQQTHLSDLLETYYKQLKIILKKSFLDPEQFYFQVRSFVPLVKLLKPIFTNDQDLWKDSQLNLIQELKNFLNCPRLLQEDCYAILSNFLGHTNYILKSFSLTPLQQKTGNFGDYFKLKMSIIIETTEKEVNLFAKFMPTNNDSTTNLVRSGPSEKEDFFYTFFISEFKKCGLKEFLGFAPKCFLSKPNYVLVLEDLSLQGYHVGEDQTFFSYEMLTLSLKRLAQLHACSLVFEETKSSGLRKKFRIDEHYGEYLQEILFQTKEENEIKIFADVGERTVTEFLIYLFPEVVKNMTMNEFNIAARKAFKRFYTQIIKSDKFRNTLCHGDAWATNLMYTFSNDNNPVDCKFVDFQLTRYCPPIQDVMSHIYLTTTKDTRTKYLNRLLEEYYQELSKIVSSFDFDMEKILSAREFRESCEYMKSQAICQALFYAPINLTRVEDRGSIFNDAENFEKIMKNDRRSFIYAMIKKYPFYKVRLGELVEDLYNICEN